MRYDFVLFDADGTLLDFLRSEDEAVREAMEISGIEPTDDKVRLYSTINDGLWKMLERGEIEKKVLLYRRFELLLEQLGVQADAKKMARDYMNILSTKAYVLDGVTEMCEKLLGKVKMYIVTNGVEFIQTGRYARCDIKKYFDGVFISDVVGWEKPAVEYFEYVAERIDGFDKSRAVIVGDSLTSDMQGGINFGIDTCWYNPKGKALPENMKLTHVTDNFVEMTDFILGEDRV